MDITREESIRKQLQDTKSEYIKNGKFYVTHVNVRQSIVLLIFRLLFLEFFFTAISISLNLILITDHYTLIDQFFAIALSVAQAFFIVYVIYRWLNEYYEIRSDMIIHRKGFFFVKEERYHFNHISSLKFEQSMLGKIFNFATVSLYHWEFEKYLPLYLIHNPRKYARLILHLNPTLDDEQHIFQMPERNEPDY